MKPPDCINEMGEFKDNTPRWGQDRSKVYNWDKPVKRVVQKRYKDPEMDMLMKLSVKELRMIARKEYIKLGICNRKEEIAFKIARARKARR